MACPTGTDLPHEARDLKDNGNKLFAAKDFAQALDCYERALALCPASPVLLSNAAACHLQLRQWQQALDAAQQCMEADPRFAKAYGRKAAAQLGLMRPGDAEKTLLAGLSVEPDNENVQQQLREIRQEDGNQRPVSSADGSAERLQALQAKAGMTMSPMALPGEAFQAACMGDIKVFRRSFKPATHLPMRATDMNFSLLHLAVVGAQRVSMAGWNPPGGCEADSDAARGAQHSEVLAAVLAAGARVDAKDVAGWTALHHATVAGPRSVLDLARQLVAAGADVNARDRFARTPLLGAVMSRHEGAVRLLLEHGAQVDVRDHEGVSAMEAAVINPKILSILHRAQSGAQQPGAPHSCASCGAGRARSMCTGCGGVWYCGRECQVAHWRAVHKAECRRGSGAAGSGAASAGPAPPPATAGAPQPRPSSSAAGDDELPQELRVPVRFDSNEFVSLVNYSSMASGGPAARHGAAVLGPGEMRERVLRATHVATRQRAMKVKLQVPGFLPGVLGVEDALEGDILCYNQDRSLVCQLVARSPAGRRLAAHIRRQGVLGAKGYFAVFFDDACRGQDGVPREMVVLTRMLPAQPW